MNIFSDMHHLDLFNSFELLFEKRLGGTVFRPIGTEWFDEGYWRIAEPYNNSRETIAQFLAIKDEEAPSSLPWLNKDSKEREGIYYADNSKAITFEKFKEMPIDIIIASWPPHYHAYTKLRDKYKPNAKVICHAGNDFKPYDWGIVKNFMASIAPIDVPSNINHIFYHQEFDTGIFKYQPSRNTLAIRSLLHNFPYYKEDYEIWKKVQESMPQFTFFENGMMGKDGVINGRENLAQAYHDSDFIFHMKPGGDGYGYVVHQAFACGRPLIVKKEYYKNCLAETLMIDGVTCIVWHSDQSIDWNVGRIKEIEMEYDDHAEMCRKAWERFNEVVNFDAEAVKLKEFIGKLK